MDGGVVLLLVAHIWRETETDASEDAEHIRVNSARRATKPESDIDFSDLPVTTGPDWHGAVRGKFYRPIKQQLTVRVDADVLEWLKSQGSGY